MSEKSAVSGFGLLPIAVACVLFFSPTGAQERYVVEGPGRVLADLAAGIVTCTLHPCLGDDERDIRRFLKGRMVSDGDTHYSDLGIAHPSVREQFRGLLQGTFGEGL